MKFEIDDKTGMIQIRHDYDPTSDRAIVTPHGIRENELEPIRQALEKTERKLEIERTSFPIIIYDSNNGFVFEDISFSDQAIITSVLRKPSPEEVEKFIKHANIAYKKLTNKQI